MLIARISWQAGETLARRLYELGRRAIQTLRGALAVRTRRAATLAHSLPISKSLAGRPVMEKRCRSPAEAGRCGDEVVPEHRISRLVERPKPKPGLAKAFPRAECVPSRASAQ